MRVKDVMTSQPAIIGSDESVQQAAIIMRDQDIGTVIVQDGSKPVGILTDRDICIRCVAEGLRVQDHTVEPIMTQNPITISQDSTCEQAVSVMEERQVRRLLVINDAGDAVGVISSGDIAQKLHDTKVTGEVFEHVTHGI